jgi:hypothetical protein
MKNLFLAIAMILCIPFLSAGQGDIYQIEVINSSVQIQSHINTTQEQFIDFGNMPAYSPGPVYLDPTDVSNAYVGQNAFQGKTIIHAQPNSSLHVAYDPFITMVNEDNEDYVINFIPQFAGNLIDNQLTSSKFVNTAGVFDFTTGSDGMYYLFSGGWLGGSGTTPAPMMNIPVGYYSGSVIIGISYN